MKLVISSLLLLSIVGCGARVEIPPAHVGKILTKDGYIDGTLTPSKFRLPACFAYCDKLVLLEVSDNMLNEQIIIFMPEDKLNLSVDVRGTYSIPSSDKYVDGLFSRLPAQKIGGRISGIPAADVYKIYGKQAVRGIVRSQIAKYTISDVINGREEIGNNIHAALRDKLESTNTPLVISRFELADIQPPRVIVEAQQAAKEREIGIQKAEADAQVELVKAEKALELAKKDRLVEREKAEAIAEQNRIAAGSVSEKLLAYRRLDVAERIYSKLAESDNVIIIPADASMISNISDDAVLAKLLGKEMRQ